MIGVASEVKNMEFNRYGMVATFSGIVALIYSFYAFIQYEKVFEVSIALAGVAFNALLTFLIAEDKLKRKR